MRLTISFWVIVFYLFSTTNIYAYGGFETPDVHTDLSGTLLQSCAFEGTYGPTIVGGTTFLKPTLSESNGTYAFDFTQRASGTSFYRSTATLDNQGNATYSNNINTSIVPIEGENFNYTITASGTTITLRKVGYPNGNTLWTRNFSIQVGEYYQNLSATKVDDRIVIAALVLNPSPFHFFLIADINGNEIAQRTTSFSASSIPFVSDVEGTPDGGFIMKYLEYPSSGIIKINANGGIVYKQNKVGDLVSNRDFYEGVALNNSGYYVGVSGRSNNYARVTKYNVNNGAILWDYRLRDVVFPNSNPVISFQRLLGIERTPDGGVIVGYGYNDLSTDTGGTWIIKFDTNGNLVWKRQLDITDLASSNPYSVEYVTSDGGFFLTKFNDDSIEVQRFNSDGLRLPECNGGGGCNVSITSSNGGVTITGLTSDANSKLFDSNTQAVWSCNPWQGNVCTNNETVSGLVTGATYFLSVQSSACNEWIPIVIQGGGTTPTCSDGIQNQGEAGIDCGGPCAPCNVGGCNVNITSSNGGVTITGLTSDANTKLFNSNTQAVFSCNPWQGNPCSGNETVSGLTTGATYFLSVQSASCNEWIPIVIQGSGGCNDSDGDGTCDEDDCRPNNPLLPTTPGTSCNDFNSNTENDVIQSDGCSCQGTTISGLCTVSYVSGTGGIFISGLTSDANVKLFNSNTQVVYSCNPWQGNPCATNGQEILGLTPGQTYFLSVQSTNCNEWIQIDFTGDTGGPRPDLSPNSLSIGSGAPGSVLDFTFNLVNAGAQISGNYSITSYISLDNSLSSDDIQEGNITTGNTPIGSSIVNGAITVPNLAAGTYYLFLVVDADGSVIESDEFNNVSVTTFEITDGGNGGGNGCTPTNVAQGKSTVQSSTLNFGGVNSGSAKAVDGNTDGNYYNGSVAATNEEFQAWWQVDLGAVYDISSIEVFNRTEGQSRLNDFYILTASTPFSGSGLALARSNANNERFIVGQAGTPTNWILSNTQARYVRIQRSGNGYLTLAELKVNACPVPMTGDAIQSFGTADTPMTSNFHVKELFPNPTTGEVIGQIESDSDGTIHVQVVNMIGQNLSSKMVDMENGTNTVQLDLQNYENGIYNVIFSDGDKIVSKRIVKL